MSNLKEQLHELALRWWNGDYDKSFEDVSTEIEADLLALVTQSNKDLLERVRGEVIGEDADIIPLNPASDEDLTIQLGDNANARLRASQRSALQRIEDEL